MAQRAATTVAECSLTLYLDSRSVSPLRLRWVKSVCVSTCNLPPAHLAERPGLLRATTVTRGWNEHRIRVSTRSWSWRRKFSRRSCRNSNSQPFDHEFGALTNKLSRKPLNNSREKPVEWPPCLAHKLKAQQHSEKLVDYEQNVRNKYIIKRRRSIPRLLVEG